VINFGGYGQGLGMPGGGRWGGDRRGDGDAQLVVPGRPRGELARSDEDIDKVFDWLLLKRIFAFMWPYRKRFYIGAFAIVLHEIVQKVQPLIHGVAINAILPETATSCRSARSISHRS
jgi:hypothetical protein